MVSGRPLEAVLAEILEIPKASIMDDLAMKDVAAWDSLKHMELITAIEQEYEMELSFDEIISMQSVAAIRRVLDDRLSDSA